ncbi:MAG TPA: GYD domain-containing protein [Rhodopila sp.]|nr:GYD domain-containing protein [Rhodopila sp.]
MQTFIMLTRLTPDAVRVPHALEDLEHKVAEHVRVSCPQVEWVGSYAVLGPYDYVDIFRAPDLDTASKVSTIVRTYGHAQTETWAASEWKHFKEVVRSLGEKAHPPAA